MTVNNNNTASRLPLPSMTSQRQTHASRDDDIISLRPTSEPVGVACRPTRNGLQHALGGASAGAPGNVNNGGENDVVENETNGERRRRNKIKKRRILFSRRRRTSWREGLGSSAISAPERASSGDTTTIGHSGKMSLVAESFSNLLLPLKIVSYLVPRHLICVSNDACVLLNVRLIR